MATGLLLHGEQSVIGAADSDAIVAGGRLDPDIFEPRLAGNAAIGNAIQCDAAGAAEVFRAGGFAQPACAGEQHLFGVVLNTPSEIFPMLHGSTGFPLAFAVGHIRLVELCRPARNADHSRR